MGLAVTALLGSAAPAQGPDKGNPLFAPASRDEVLLELASSLGEPRGFCVDFPGFPVSGIVSQYREANWPIGAHSCKIGIAHANVAMIDQLFSISALAGHDQHLRFSRLKVCAEVISFRNVSAPGHVREDAVREDAQIIATPCTDKAEQRFVMDAAGHIRPVLDTTRCLTIGREAFEAGDRSPGHPWYRRDLQIHRCSPRDAARQRWRQASVPQTVSPSASAGAS